MTTSPEPGPRDGTTPARRGRRRRRRHGRPPLRRGRASTRGAAPAAGDVTVLAEEPRAAVRPGRTSPRTSPVATRRRCRSATRACGTDPTVTLRRGDAVVEVDRGASTVRTVTAHGRPGRATRTTTSCSPPARRRSSRRSRATTCPACFVYRTIDDVATCAARRGARGDGRRRGGGTRARRASSAAGCSASRPPDALRALGLETHVVEFAPRLMPLQVDERRRRGAARGTSRSSASPCTPARRPSGIAAGDGGRRGPAWTLADGGRGSTPTSSSSPPASGRATSSPARAGLEVGERGGVAGRRARAAPRTRTSRPIGECACIGGRMPTASSPPATRWPRSSPTRLLGGAGTLPRRRHVHQAQAARRRRRQLRRRVRARADGAPRASSYADPVAGVYKKLVVSDDAQDRCSAAILVGDAARTASLRPMLGAARAARRPGGAAPARPGGGGARRASDLPDDAQVCSCNNVTGRRHPRRGRRARLRPTSAGVKACTRAGTHAAARACRWSRSSSTTELAASGVDRRARRLCEHFDLSRAGALRRRRACTGSRTLRRARRARTARGRGCDICKPDGRLDPGHASSTATSSTASSAALQDTNDHFLANIQTDGTYSVVPRIPGGEITPGEADRDRRGRAGLRPLHEDHRRPADRPVRRPDRAAAARSGGGWSTPASSRATPTASRCAR